MVFGWNGLKLKEASGLPGKKKLSKNTTQGIKQ
jgi:hypothetical protein